jgi:hypothetical protein
MNARIQRISSRVLSVALLSSAIFVGSAIEARAACTPLAASKPSALVTKVSPLASAVRLARPGTAPVLAAAAQGGGSNGGGPIVGMWQVVMTASPGTPGEFIFDFAFQHFHADGTEMMSSGGVPPTVGNVCLGAWERGSDGMIRVRHVGWNFAGGALVFGDLPTGYFYMEVTLRTNSQGTAYSGTWKAASYDLGAGPLGSGGPPQPDTDFEGTIQAARISAP